MSLQFKSTSDNSQFIAEIDEKKIKFKVDSTSGIALPVLSIVDNSKGKIQGALETHKSEERLIESKENAELEAEIKEYIIGRQNARVENTRASKLELNDKDIKKVELSDISILEILPRQIKIDGKIENFKILKLNVQGINYTAFQVPERYQGKKYSEMYAGLEFSENEGEYWFPNGLNKECELSFIIWETESHKKEDGTFHTDIQPRNPYKNTDVVRECAKYGAEPQSIYESIIITQIVHDGLGRRYVNDKWFNSSNYKRLRKKIEKIDEYLGMKFGEYIGEECIVGNIGEECIVRNIGVYNGQNNIRLSFYCSHNTIDYGFAGIQSGLSSSLKSIQSSNRGFRLSL